MHFVGKILVVLQLVLSIFFMAFAGVVYNHQMSWRKAYETGQTNLSKTQKERDDALAEKERLNTDLTRQANVSEQRAKAVEIANKGLLADVERLKKESGDLAVARKRASEEALIAGEESSARTEEATNLRSINFDQSKARDIEFQIRTKLEDDKYSLQLDLDTAKKKNRELLTRVSILQQALESAGISADVNELAARNSPPPRVEGKILDLLIPQRQGASELVEISLGSDQGLKNGHEMTVYRTGLSGGQQPKFLAKIVIVKTTPDKAVGQVIEGIRNGVIKKGDNVTTKL